MWHAEGMYDYYNYSVFKVKNNLKKNKEICKNLNNNLKNELECLKWTLDLKIRFFCKLIKLVPIMQIKQFFKLIQW